MTEPDRETLGGHELLTRVLTRPDGRTLAWAEAGPENGPALLHLHGSGSCRLEIALAAGEAAKRSFRVMGIDRPGYGQSSPYPGRSIQDFVDDLSRVMDAAGVDTAVVSGWSGGAPHALAAAAIRPDRVVGAVMLNTAGDRRHPAWKSQPIAARLFVSIAIQRWFYALAWPAALKSMQAKAKKGEANDVIAVRLFEEGGRQGMDAVWQEIALFYHQPWGVDWRALTRPVLVLQGHKDPNLSFARAAALACPMAAFETIPGGHMDGGVPAVWARIFDWAATQLGSRP